MSWTEAETDFATARWVAGDSAAIIARDIGRQFGRPKTRNAVIGKLSRKGFGRGDKPSAPEKCRSLWGTGKPIVVRTPRPPKPGPQNKPAVVFGKVGTHTGEELEQRRARTAATGQAIADRFAAPANDDAIPLMGRRRVQCAWPVGIPERPAEQMCCGATVPEDANVSVASYCIHHAGLAISRVLKSAPDAKVYERSMRRFA